MPPQKNNYQSGRSLFFQSPALDPENRFSSHHIGLDAEPQLSLYPDNLRLKSILTGIAVIFRNRGQNFPNFWTPETWLGLLPAVAVMGLGILFAPNFAIGLVIGVLQCTIGNLISLAAQAIFPLARDKNDRYLIDVLNNTIITTLYGPILEETLFRGALQPLLIAAISWLAPVAATALLFGIGLTVAAMLSIFVTSIIFGAMHISNEHKGSYRQAAICFIGGIVFGAVAMQYGLVASIAAHIINNTLAITLAAFLSGVQNENETQTQTSINSQDEPEFNWYTFVPRV